MAKRPKLSFGNKDVVREAFERKHGGSVSAPRLDKRGRGSDKSPFAKSSSKNPFSSAKKGS
jgi:hypothetical protein